jgi:hypothetical protein
VKRQLFGKVSSMSEHGDGCLVIVCFKSPSGVSAVPFTVNRQEALELVPGDEFRLDLTRTGFTERSAAALEAGTLGKPEPRGA